MNEFGCSDAFAPKYVLRKVSSLLQGHYLLESDDGVTINIDIWAMFGPGRDIHVYQYCSVLCLFSRAGLWRQHAAPRITVWDCQPLSHQSGKGHKRRLLSISVERSTCGQDMCTVADTSSYIHAVWHHWVTKAVGNVSPIKLLQKTETFQNILSKLEDT